MIWRHVRNFFKRMSCILTIFSRIAYLIGIGDLTGHISRLNRQTFLEIGIIVRSTHTRSPMSILVAFSYHIQKPGFYDFPTRMLPALSYRLPCSWHLFICCPYESSTIPTFIYYNLLLTFKHRSKMSKTSI